MHGLIPCNRCFSCCKSLEPLTPHYSPLRKTMVLPNNIIQILNLPNLSLHWDSSLILNSLECRRVCSVFINVDDSRNTTVTIGKRLSKKFLSCRFVSSLTKHPIKGVPFRINCSIKVIPFPFDLDVGLIYSVWKGSGRCLDDKNRKWNTRAMERDLSRG